MEQRFSRQLVKDYQRIMSKRAGFPISADQAEMGLARLARLGNLIPRVFGKKENSINAQKSNEKNNSNR
jgi:hypothetical protein